MTNEKLECIAFLVLGVNKFVTAWEDAEDAILLSQVTFHSWRFHWPRREVSTFELVRRIKESFKLFWERNARGETPELNSW